MRENSFHRKVMGIDDSISCPNSSGMMRVAGGSHGQTANLRILESVTVVAAECGRRVENLDRIHRQHFQSGKTDAGAEQIIWMRRNGEAATFMNDVANFACWLSFQVGQFRTDTEKMTIGGRDLDSRKNEKIVDRQPVQPHEALLEQVINRVARVVIGDGDAVQTFGARGCNQVFRAGDTVSRKKRMRMQVDIKRHCERLRPFLSKSLHELFNKNGCFGFGFLLNTIELVIV